MKYTPVSEISRVADVHPVPLRPPMTRVERLERWAEALEREPDRVRPRLRRSNGSRKTSAGRCVRKAQP